MKKRALAGTLTLGLTALVLATSVFGPGTPVLAAPTGESRTSNTYVRNGEFIPVKLRKQAEKADRKSRGKGGKYVYVIGKTNADKKENTAEAKEPGDVSEEARTHQIMTKKKGKKQYDQVYVIGETNREEAGDRHEVRVKKEEPAPEGKQLPKRKRGQKYDQVYVIGQTNRDKEENTATPRGGDSTQIMTKKGEEDQSPRQGEARQQAGAYEAGGEEGQEANSHQIMTNKEARERAEAEPAPPQQGNESYSQVYVIGSTGKKENSNQPVEGPSPAPGSGLGPGRPSSELQYQAPPAETGAENPMAPYLGKLITKHVVEGNKLVPTEEVLAVLKTKAGTPLTEQGLSEDLSAIYGLGYFYDLRPEYVRVPEGVQLVYHVLENPLYKGVAVQGSTVKLDKAPEAYFDLEEGRIANLREINQCVQNLQEAYRAQGYILARVTDVHMNPDGILGITVNEGIVEGFKTKGNVKCKDYVITREMRLKVGKPFNAKDARRSMQRIYNLGYFEDVNVRLNPGREPNAVEVEISVVEMNTGTFGIGAGYSNADGFIGMISIGDKNFRGIGDKVNIRWEFGGEDNKNYDFTYTRPWLDNKETTGTINLYDITNEYEDYDIDDHRIARYDKKRRGQELTLSRKTDNDFISNFIVLKNRQDIYKGVADGYEGSTQYYESSYDSHRKYYEPATADARRKENFGTTRSITIGRIFDSRDNIYDPHEGKRTSYSIEHAGFMGGDFDFTKFSADWRYYYRGGGQTVWALNLAAGYAEGDMPLSQRFRMGGSDTLRGYEDDQFRGNSMVKATLEYRFPIIKRVQGVLFNDNGYAWDKRFQDDFDLGLVKSSVGVGVRVNSPLGPIKVDYGVGDDGGKFHFSFGGQF